MLKLLNVYLLIFISHLIQAQSPWTRIDLSKDLAINDIVTKSDGTVYFSIKGSENIISYNILSGNQSLIELPRMLSYPYSNIDNLTLAIDFDNTLVANTFRFGVYKFNGIEFVRPILRDTQIVPNILFLETIKFDSNGSLYFNQGSDIIKRKEPWSNRGEIKVFDQTGYITNYFPFSDSINYSINLNNKNTIIYKFNSVDGRSRKLLSLPYEVNNHSLVNAKGDMILGVGQELFYYKKEGLDLFAPIIDSSSNNTGLVKGIFQSISSNAIICYKGTSFYVTYDSCQTWFKVFNMSNKIPAGILGKLIFWDTSHVILQMHTSFCGGKELFELIPNSLSWKKVIIDKSNYSFSRIVSHANEFIAEYECFYLKSKNEGRDWDFMISPYNNLIHNYGHYIRKISLNSSEQVLFTFEAFRDSLFRSLDFGNTWNFNVEIKRIKQVFHVNSSELFLFSETGTPAMPFADIYYSDNNGESWQLIAKNTIFTNSIQSIKYDFDGNLIMLIGPKLESKVYLSKNKGVTWLQDNRFNNYSVSDIVFEKDGRCLISGINNLSNKYGLFASYDFNNFINLSSNINNSFITYFKVLNSGKYIAYAGSYSKTNDRGLFFTEDDGKNWINYSYNLPDFHSSDKVHEISDIIIDKKGYLHVSLINDGFWRYNTKLVSIEETFRNTEISIHPNPVIDNLMINLDNDYVSEKLNVKIVNLLGINLFEKTISGNSIIPISFLSQGTYFLNLYSNNKLIHSAKILKYEND